MKKKVLIVISDYYKEIGKNLLKGSINELKLNNINYDILFAPGCFEIPFLISKNIKKYSKNTEFLKDVSIFIYMIQIYLILFYNFFLYILYMAYYPIYVFYTSFFDN